MKNNTLIDAKSNSNNTEINNKLALECSYLINEIKRKNSSLLLPIFITNKKIYLKDKLLSTKKCNFNYKNKNSIKQLICRNIQKKNYLKNLSVDNILPKKININKSNDKISLTSLYKLPKLKYNKKINKSKSAVILHSNNNNNSINFNNFENQKLQQKEEKVGKLKKKNNFLGIENFMKEKFYSDTENKLRNNIQTKYFRNDWMIKDKIIFLKKFGIFWRGFIQYCTPIIKLKKYQLDFLNKKQNYNDDTDLNYDNNNNRIIHNNRYLYNSDENSKAVETVKSHSLPKIDPSRRKVN